MAVDVGRREGIWRNEPVVLVERIPTSGDGTSLAILDIIPPDWIGTFGHGTVIGHACNETSLLYQQAVPSRSKLG